MKDQDDRDLTPKLSEIGLSNYAPYLMNRIMGRYNSSIRDEMAALDLTTPKMRSLAVLSVIDNLVKGASGQAIQAFNVRFGLDEGEGLRAPAMWP